MSVAKLKNRLSEQYGKVAALRKRLLEETKAIRKTKFELLRELLDKNIETLRERGRIEKITFVDLDDGRRKKTEELVPLRTGHPYPLYGYFVYYLVSEKKFVELCVPDPCDWACDEETTGRRLGEEELEKAVSVSKTIKNVQKFLNDSLREPEDWAFVEDFARIKFYPLHIAGR